MAITPLPSLDRTSATFKTDVNTFFATKLPTFSTEAEAARAEITTNTATASSAATTATNAATTATTKASDASTSAAAAATSATNAGNSASAAATSATNAGNSASAAATSATAAAASAASVDVSLSAIHAATSKATPVDADEVSLLDSAASFGLKKVTWANIKATLKTYFDSVATTLSNKTLTAPVITGYTETVYTLTGTDINPANGTVQTKTLAANTTFTESIADGQSVVLHLNPATYTTTWPTISWVNAAGSGAAPTLKASAMNVVVLWQVAGVLYGNWIGSL